MSQKQIDSLKAYLQSAGFVEGEDYHISAGEGNSAQFSVEIGLDKTELPEELLGFDHNPDEIERMIWKGNTEKRTYNGARFELALSRYGSSIMDKDPEIIALNARVHSEDESLIPRLAEYEAIRKRVWDRIWAEPKHAAWEKDLNENYL